MSLLPRLRNVARSTLESAWFFDVQQRLTIGPVDLLLGEIERELKQLQPRSVLDVGCGTGTFASTVPGDYLGIDVNPTYISRAQNRYAGQPNRRFLVADAVTYPFGDQDFDVTLYVNAIHHFDDQGVLRILRALHRITRDALVVAEPAPETWMPVSRLLIALDQGAWVRPLPALLALLDAADFAVDRHHTFYRGFAHTRLLVARPRRG